MLFFNAFKNIFNNPKMVFIPLSYLFILFVICVGVPIGSVILLVTYVDGFNTENATTIYDMLSYFVAVLFGMFYYWVNVFWHRAIILTERNAFFYPSSYLLEFWRYLFWCILFIIPYSILKVIFTVSIAITASFFTTGLIFLIYVFINYFLIFRLGLCFPAAALGKNLGMLASWKHTDPYKIDLLWATLWMTLAINCIVLTSRVWPKFELMTSLIALLVIPIITNIILSRIYLRVQNDLKLEKIESTSI